MSPLLMKRLQYALFSALLFYIIANPITFSVVDSIARPILNIPIANGGCPTGVGLLVHTAVFFLVKLGLMYL